MRRIYFIVWFGVIWPGLSQAGIEAELFLKQYEACTVRIYHDATPDATSGVLVIRPYLEKDGVHERCESLEKKHITQSLTQALQAYKKRDDLKPVTSLMLGRLVNYPWIKTTLAAQAGVPSVKKLSRRQFNAFVLKDEMMTPFKQALELQGFRLTGASCEKLIFYDNGAPQDAMCWLVIERRD